MIKMKWAVPTVAFLALTAWFIWRPDAQTEHHVAKGVSDTTAITEISQQSPIKSGPHHDHSSATHSPSERSEEDANRIDPELLAYLAKDELAKGIPLSDIQAAVAELDNDALAYLRLEALQSLVVDRLNTIATGEGNQLDAAERQALISDIQSLQARGAVLGTEAEMMVQYVRNSAK